MRSPDFRHDNVTLFKTGAIVVEALFFEISELEIYTPRVITDCAGRPKGNRF